MLLRPSHKRQTLDLSVKIDNNNIECVKETVFLGSLTFLAFLENIKINRNYLQVNFCLPKTFLRSSHYSLVCPYLKYCVYSFKQDTLA